MIPGKQQDGYVIVVVTALLVVLLGFAALAVDVGILYGSRTAMQRAADAAALAGAYTFMSEPRATQPATAIDRARSTAYRNSVLGNYVLPSEVTVTVDTSLRRVTVDITHNEDTYFAKALNWNLATLAVRAIAEASPASTSSYCTKPWFIPNTILSTMPPCEAQAAGEIMLYIDPTTGQKSVTTWAQNLINVGHQFAVKPGQPSTAAGPGQFYCIRLADSTGGNDYRTNIGRCSPENIVCGSYYPVEPGNMIGPTAQGARDLLTIFGAVTADEWVSIDTYRYPDGTTGPTSHQLITVPIWDVGDPGMMDCDPASTHYNMLGGGATVDIKVVGFASLFIERVSGNDVIARLIGLSPCAAAGGGVEVTEGGPFSIPLRLIRTD